MNELKVSRGQTWQALTKSAVYVYDLKTKESYELTLGIEPEWSPSGEKIAYLTYDDKIGILNLSDGKKIELSTKGDIELSPFHMAWCPQEDNILYLAKPKHTFLGYFKALTKIYERPLSLWMAKTDNTQEQYIQTRNFGDIACVDEDAARTIKKHFQ